MFTEAQILYLEEVLGTSVDQFRGTAPANSTDVAVVTPFLSPEEGALLVKILASVHLTDYLHLQPTDPIPTTVAHVLVFEQAFGRRAEAGQAWWGLPSVTSMIGTGTLVANHKREAWSCLQQFQKERQ